MFKVGQVYKVVNPEGTGIRSCEKVEVTEVLNNRQAAAKSLGGGDVFYGIHVLMVEDGSIELEDPFSHLYTKEKNRHVIKLNTHESSITITHGDATGIIIKTGDDCECCIYYDELEPLLAVLLDIHKEKYGGK